MLAARFVSDNVGNTVTGCGFTINERTRQDQAFQRLMIIVVLPQRFHRYPRL